MNIGSSSARLAGWLFTAEIQRSGAEIKREQPRWLSLEQASLSSPVRTRIIHKFLRREKRDAVSVRQSRGAEAPGPRIWLTCTGVVFGGN
jgi:hypothetical protein